MGEGQQRSHLFLEIVKLQLVLAQERLVAFDRISGITDLGPQW
ncbi:MAG: hypothetical protein ACRYFU_11510 [Janthinobacterium lividum]